VVAISVEDPRNPVLLHNPVTDHQIELFDIAGNYAYVADQILFGAGIRIVDISNPHEPVELGECVYHFANPPQSIVRCINDLVSLLIHDQITGNQYLHDIVQDKRLLTRPVQNKNLNSGRRNSV